MNIATFSHYFSPEIGAPSARIFDLSQQWVKKGHHVEVVTCFPNHPTGKIYLGYNAGKYMREDFEGITVHRNWTYITPNKGFLKKTLGHVSFFPSSCLFSNRKLNQPDVAIGTSPTFFAAMAAHSAAKRFRVPFIMEVRDLWPACFVELGVLKNRTMIYGLEKLELSLYRRAHKVVTVTEAFRQNLIERGVSREKVHTIPNGADEVFWQPAEKPKALQQRLGLAGKFIALYIGAHGISQALARILESAERLKNVEDIHFVFVGEGAEKDQLVQAAKNKGLRNIQFLDPVGKYEVKEMYALADVCLVPLRNIPLFKTFIPSKMFEMMAMERGIVASVEGEAADILSQSGGALVVQPENAEQIAGAILRLRQNPDQLKKMGRRGRQFVIDHYSRKALAEKYLSVILEAKAAFQR